jgi:hypothetical protein
MPNGDEVFSMTTGVGTPDGYVQTGAKWFRGREQLDAEMGDLRRGKQLADASGIIAQNFNATVKEYFEDVAKGTSMAFGPAAAFLVHGVIGGAEAEHEVSERRNKGQDIGGAQEAGYVIAQGLWQGLAGAALGKTPGSFGDGGAFGAAAKRFGVAGGLGGGRRRART